MTLIRHATASGGTKIPPGTYRVLLMDLKEDLLENALYGNGNVIRFELEVCQHVDVSGNPIQLDALANDKLTPKSKLWQVATSLNVQPVLGQGFDTDDLLGRRANLVIKHIDTTSGPKAKIVDMLKVGGAAPAAVPAGAVEQEWCHVCTLKGKRTPLAKYAATGEPLCEVHDDDDLK